ncbi:hypothetical protein M3Y94_00736700 [Aphelenchoides besseyi]|nr:hypothetical protein M3Y94_00736700 [Aphelenchoides besseyi]
MSDFNAYIDRIQDDGAYLESGIVKIVPPVEWRDKNNFAYDRIHQFEIPRCVSGTMHKVSDGVYWNQNTFVSNKLTVDEFLAKTKDRNSMAFANCQTIDELIGDFWSNQDQDQSQSLYSPDVQGTLFTDRVIEFNLNSLGSFLDDVDLSFPGVSDPYLYFGSYRTVFAFHIEDANLLSLNYQHFGEPKIWYAISPVAAPRFERLCAMLYPLFARSCHNFLKHKISIIDPKILRHFKIPFSCVVQYPQEFILTFPNAYHQGFNAGFNCNEAINLANKRWIRYGLESAICKCNPEMSVQISISELLMNRSDELQPYLVREIRTAKNKVAYLGTKTIRNHWEKNSIFCSSFQKESKFNKEKARNWPFCAVCCFFSFGTKRCKVNNRSQRFISDSLLTKNEPINLSVATDMSLLRQCSICSLMVHHDCYSKSSVNAGKWLCDRCALDEDRELAVCEFCYTRGGALIRFWQSGMKNEECSFVHVVCAMMSRVTIVEWQTNGSMLAKRVSNELPFVKNKSELFVGSTNDCFCSLCSELISYSIVKCEGCFNEQRYQQDAFHPICANMVGYRLEVREFPDVTVAICPEHLRKSTQKRSRSTMNSNKRPRLSPD